MKRLILIDGNSLMYRAYFALAYTGNLMQNKKGLYTNAIYAFVNMINSLTNSDYDNILVAFDAGKKTFRHDTYADYKGGRNPMPEEMRVQIPYIKKFLELSRIKQYELPLYEADDIIGTIAKQAEKENFHVDIYSSDKDLLQLISDKTTVHMTKKGISDLESFDKKYFQEKYLIDSSLMIDLKGLMGDASDNLKGIAGVGEKTAVKLLQQYGSLEGIIENKDNIKGKLGEKIQSDYENAITCKKMATIETASPLEITIKDTIKEDRDEEALHDFYLELEFHSMLKHTQQIVKREENLYEIITDDFSKALINDSAIYMEMLEDNYHYGKIVGFSITNENGNFYIDKEKLKCSSFIEYLENPNINKKTYGYKKMYVSLKREGIDLKGVSFDLLIASYILNPKIAKDDFKVVVTNYNYENVSYDEEIYNKGAKLNLGEPEKYQKHMIDKSKAIYVLYDDIIKKLYEQNQYNLFSNIEMPLAHVLGKMELNGMKISVDELNNQRQELASRIIKLEDEIYDMVGFEFNISSPKQLGEVLFEKMGLPSSKKTKTGYSTNSDVLEELSSSHPLPEKILQYRQITKLYSTYIEGIKHSIFEDGKVHTIFQQTLTETGRLSSIEPNLQNIPIRTKEGALIRKMFVPENDYLLSMDYSQIELRVLADMANVKNLKDAFISNRDVHEETAKAIFKKDMVTKDERRAAKAVNFGIIYGISAWGLSKDVGVTPKEAQGFIDDYMETYPEIKEFMDKVIDNAKKDGYVKTILNRRRYIPEINSPVYMQREFGKRMAMNAPIQGSAADIIKKAMVGIDKKMQEQGLHSKLIIQVHDELIFDCLDNELEIMIKLVKEGMENVMNLSIPLIVDGGYGKTWYDAK